MATDRLDTGSAAAALAARPVVTGALAAGLVLRLVFGLGYWVDKPLTLDEREYLLLARNVAAGQGFQYRLADGSTAPGEHFGRAPVYPLLLAALVRVTGPAGAPLLPAGPDEPESPALLAAIKITQAAASLVIVWLIAWLAQRAAGASAAALAAWLAALYPPLVWMPAYVLSETFYGVLALGCAALLVRASGRPPAPGTSTDRRPLPPLVAIAGGLAGLGILTRPALLFFVALAAPWLWWRRSLGAAALFVVAAAVVVAPWTLRNVAEHGRLVLVASEGGITFWTGNHPLAIGEGDMAANLPVKRANVEFRNRHAGLSPEQLEPLYYREALDWIAAHPGAAAALVARKAFYTVVPFGPSYRLHSARYFWASVASYLAVLPFGCLGIAALARRRRLPESLAVLAVSSMAVCLIFFPQERFRIPVIDPTLLVCAACWWSLRRTPAAPDRPEVRA